MKAQKTKKEGKLILPPPTANGRGELAPFLKAKDIREMGITEITLLGEGRKSNSPFGKGIDVACQIGNNKYTWTIKYDVPEHRSPNYSRLFERFGDEVTKWKGTVKVGRRKHMGKEYVAVVD